MEGLSPYHLLFILIVAVLEVGPGKLPEVGAALGRTLRSFREGMSETAPPDPDRPSTPDRPS